MKATLPGLIGVTPRKGIAAPAKEGEGDRKPLAEDLRPQIGEAIAAAIDAAGLSRGAVAYDMGSRTKDDAPDASALSRWIAGVETAQFAKLWLVVPLRAHLVIALAQLAEDVTIETVVRLQRRRSA